MRIGTTPTHQFTLPFDVETLLALEITYSQDNQVVLQKREQDCTMEGNMVSVTLSQEETFGFDEYMNVEIQLRVLTTGNNVFSSDIFNVSCKRCLSDEVL